MFASTVINSLIILAILRSICGNIQEKNHLNVQTVMSILPGTVLLNVTYRHASMELELRREGRSCMNVRFATASSIAGTSLKTTWFFIQ
ncbi:unnamed protein product, partial [Staurois parvus]